MGLFTFLYFRLITSEFLYTYLACVQQQTNNLHLVSLAVKLVTENPLFPYNKYHFTATQLELQTAICQSKEEETARQLAELRKERDALQTEVEQLKSGKMNERHFSAAFQKEFEKRGEFQAKYHQVLDRCAVSGFEICMELIWCLYSHK